MSKFSQYSTQSTIASSDTFLFLDQNDSTATKLNQIESGQLATALIRSHNVKDYGATGDGTTDDTTAVEAAITAAIASGDPVYFPAGNYALTKLTTITAQGLHLIGAGGRKTILTFNSDGDDCITIGTTGTYGVVISDIGFDNAAGTTPASFVKLGYGVHTLLNRLAFRQTAATYAIDNVQGHSLNIIEPEFANFTGTGIRLRNDGAVSEYSNLIRIVRMKSGNSNSGDCIEIEGGNSISIRDCHFEQWTNAIEFTGAQMLRGLVVDGCYFENITNALNVTSDGNTEYIRNGHFTNCRAQTGAGAIELGDYSELKMTNCAGKSGSWAVTAGAGSSAKLVIDETVQWTADTNIGEVYLRALTDYSENVVGSSAITPYGITLLASSSGAVTPTLGSGQYVGQTKWVGMSDASNASTLTVTDHLEAGTGSFIYNSTGDFAVFIWGAGGWVTLKNFGVGTT